MYKSWHCVRRLWGGEFVRGAALLLGENHTFPILELKHRHRVNRRQNCPREIELIRESLCDGMLRITDRALYIGKTKSLRGRFSGGHKAFLWAWLDKYSDEDIRIAVQTISHA
jgi:hypothetical protein